MLLASAEKACVESHCDIHIQGKQEKRLIKLPVGFVGKIPLKLSDDRGGGAPIDLTSNYGHICEGTETFLRDFKGIFHPNMNILSVYLPSCHSKPDFFFTSEEHKRRIP